MAELSTLARPYARAAFDVARKAKVLPKWSEMLQFAAAAARDPRLAPVLDDPRYTREQIAEMFIQVCGKQLNKDARNFIRVLSDNRRLPLLPKIAELFNIYRAEAENTVKVEVVSGSEFTAAQQKKLAAHLKKRFGREVQLEYTVDENMLGGAIVRAGDEVIDGSVRGQLSKLASALVQ